MTDIFAKGPGTLELRVPRPRLPRPQFGASFEKTCELVSNAFRLAYVAPYASRQPPASREAAPDGRDPNW